MFAAPDSMLLAIRDYCETHHQPIPATRAQVCRCLFDSLVNRYKTVFDWLQDFAPFTIDTLHIIGGGSLNAGTALGNIMLQAKANGGVGDIWDMRHVIAQSITLKEYQPNK